MLLSGLASVKKQGKKQPMMPESSQAGAPKNCNRCYAIIKKCKRTNAFRNLARMFFKNWEFVLANYISYGCSRTD
jgi:hypothetical protein